MMEERTEQVTGATEKSVKLLTLVGNALSRHSNNLTAAAQRAVSQVDSVSDGLVARADQLAGVADRSSLHLRELGKTLRHRLQELLGASESAATRIEDSAETLGLRSEEVSAAAAGADDRLDRVGRTLETRARQATAATDSSLARLQSIGDFLADRSGMAAARAGDIFARMTAANEALNRQLEDLTAAYATTEQGIDALGEALARRAAEVGRVSGDAVDKVDAWDTTLQNRADALTEATNRIAAQARRVAVVMDRQTKDIRAASAQAQALVGDLEARAEETGIDDFLRRAAFISEGLQSLAIDMNRVMEVPLTEDDWRRFNRGEKGIFVRKILGFRERAKLTAVNQRFQQDAQFRDYVTRYLSQFEALLKESKKRDRDGVLATTFLSSEMGKVYMILGRALGRDI
jgi:hypothetical protein